LNNRLDNLQLITHRENISKDRFRHNYSSKYVGVYWDKSRNKWMARIGINKKMKFLGRFTSELEANSAYKTALSQIND